MYSRIILFFVGEHHKDVKNIATTSEKCSCVKIKTLLHAVNKRAAGTTTVN